MLTCIGRCECIFSRRLTLFAPADDDDVANRGSGSDGGGSRDGTSQPTSCIRGYFHTRPVHVSAAYEPQLVDFSAIITELNNAVDQFTCHGRGYVMMRVTKLTAVMVPFNPLVGGGGSSYIPTPRRIANKHAVVYVKNLHGVVSRNSARRLDFEIHFPQKRPTVVPSIFPSIRNSFQTSSDITPALRFTVWRTTRRTSHFLYYTFRHTCIRVRNESAYTC